MDEDIKRKIESELEPDLTSVAKRMKNIATELIDYIDNCPRLDFAKNAYQPMTDDEKNELVGKIIDYTIEKLLNLCCDES